MKLSKSIGALIWGRCSELYLAVGGKHVARLNTLLYWCLSQEDYKGMSIASQKETHPNRDLHHGLTDIHCLRDWGISAVQIIEDIHFTENY